MHKTIERSLTIAVFAALIFGVYATFSGNCGGAAINRWQVEHLTQGGKFFPILTILIMMLPVVVIALPIKLWLKRKG